MAWFGRLVSSLTGSVGPISGFAVDFQIEDPAQVSVPGPGGLRWTVRDGTRVCSSSSGGGADSSSGGTGAGAGAFAGAGDAASVDGNGKMPVSVFSCAIEPRTEELVRNVLRRAKTLVIPGVLRCFESAEHDGTAYFATERCVPLRAAVADHRAFYNKNGNSNSNDDRADDYHRQFDIAVAFGMHTVAGALAAMHRNQLLHGQVNLDSVFALAHSGEWRLWGLELVSAAAGGDISSTPFRNAPSLLMPHRLAPEMGGLAGKNQQQYSGSSSSVEEVALADSWGAGILLYEVFVAAAAASSSSSSPAPPTPSVLNDLKMPRCVPEHFMSSYNSIVVPNAKARWSCARFHAEAPMALASSSSSSSSSSKAVKMMTELDELSLKDATDRDVFYRELATCVKQIPPKLAQGLVLPKISRLLQYGGCSAAALSPVLQIAEAMSADDFALRVAPSVLVLFASQEPLVRMKLLESASQYARLLPEKLMCERIWPLYLQGLTSKIPELRELSVRALVNFAPALGERFQSGDVVKALLQLQQDPQGAIRTNATICLGMLAPFLPSESRAKTLCNGLGRMLKDPYPASRAAAVRTISTLADAFTAPMLCEQLLPALCPMLLDGDSGVREVATATVRTLLEQAVGEAEAVPFAAVASTPTPTPTTTTPTPTPTSPTGGSAAASAGAAGVTPVRSPVAPVASSSSSSSAVPSSSSTAFPTQRALVLNSSSGLAAKKKQPPAVAATTTTASATTTTTASAKDVWGSIDDDDFKIDDAPKPTATTKPPPPKPVVKSVASWGDDDLFADEDDGEFTISSSKSTKAAAAPPKQHADPAPPLQVIPAATSSSAASSGAAGMKLGGAKKRGFGGVKSG